MCVCGVMWVGWWVGGSCKPEPKLLSRQPDESGRTHTHIHTHTHTCKNTTALPKTPLPPPPRPCPSQRYSRRHQHAAVGLPDLAQLFSYPLTLGAAVG